MLIITYHIDMFFRFDRLKVFFFWIYVLIQKFEVCFSKIGAILDFDPLYKFEMTFDLYSYVT